MKNLHRLRIFPTIEKVLGGLLKTEDHEAEEKGDQSDRAQREQRISPAHVGSLGAACRARRHIIAGGQRSAIGLRATAVFWDKAIADTGCHHDT